MKGLLQYSHLCYFKTFKQTTKIRLSLKYGMNYRNHVKIKKLYVIKQVNNVTMNNLFFMLCQFRSVDLYSSISNHVQYFQSGKVWQFCKSFDKKKKKRQVPITNSSKLYYALLSIISNITERLETIYHSKCLCNANIIQQQVNLISSSACS
jgi:hypothetical protein